jgi:hypothetical protein
VSSPKGGFPEPHSPDLSSGRYRRRDLTDDIFIKYVNSPLENDPTALHGIYDLISLFVSIPQEINFLTKQVIDLIIKLSEFNSHLEAYEHLEKLKARVHNPRYSPLVLESAYSDVYGYLEGYCLKICPFLGGIDKALAIGSDRFGNNDHIKCYECNQKYVQYVADEIISQTAFSEIVGLSNFLALGRQVFRSGFSIGKTTDGLRENIIEQIIYDPFNQMLSFGIFLGSAVSYSLGSFLTRLDSKKKHPLYLRLKKCCFCGKFKIGERIVKQSQKSFCSQECKDLYHREIRKRTKYHTEYMRKYPRD